MSDLATQTACAPGQQEELLCQASAKWAALVDDVVVPIPQRHVSVAVIKAQANLGDEFRLVRDHNSPDDVVLEDTQTVDLASGNVFYRLRLCDLQPRGKCGAPPKLAFFVDDRAEVTTRADQDGKTLRQLFNLSLNSQLVRDTEVRRDEAIGLEEDAKFSDGPVFYTRNVQHALKITVNARVFSEDDGVKSVMTGKEIASLVYREKPSETCVWFVSDGNRPVRLDEKVEIKGCEVFDVVRKEVTGGYQADRVQNELTVLQTSGAKVTLLASPVAAVVYHELRTRSGLAIPATDVLVLVPGAYPGQMIDGAYLPADSPLLGKVKGQVQDTRVTALDRVWRLVSYHPHNGGGAPPWNPGQHGFHTYIGELLSWLYNAN